MATDSSMPFAGATAKPATAMLTEDADFYTRMGQLANPQEVAGLMKGLAVAMPDAAFVIEQWVEQGDSGVAVGRHTGTQAGPLAGPMGEIPAAAPSICPLPPYSALGTAGSRPPVPTGTTLPS